MYACLTSSVLWGTDKVLRAIDLLFDSNFFQSFLFGGKFIYFQLYWSIKGYIFVILSGLLWFFDNLMQQLKHIESTYHHYFLDLLLSFDFLTIRENLYMIQFYLSLVYEVHKAINQLYQKQNHFLSLTLLILLDIFVKEIQKVIQ